MDIPWRDVGLILLGAFVSPLARDTYYWSIDAGRSASATARNYVSSIYDSYFGDDPDEITAEDLAEAIRVSEDFSDDDEASMQELADNLSGFSDMDFEIDTGWQPPRVPPSNDSDDREQ